MALIAQEHHSIRFSSQTKSFYYFTISSIDGEATVETSDF